MSRAWHRHGKPVETRRLPEHFQAHGNAVVYSSAGAILIIGVLALKRQGTCPLGL